MPLKLQNYFITCRARVEMKSKTNINISSPMCHHPTGSRFGSILRVLKGSFLPPRDDNGNWKWSILITASAESDENARKHTSSSQAVRQPDRRPETYARSRDDGTGVGSLSSLLIHRSTAVLLYVSLRTFLADSIGVPFIALTVTVWCYAQDASQCLFQSHPWVGRACCQSTTSAAESLIVPVPCPVLPICRKIRA